MRHIPFLKFNSFMQQKAEHSCDLRYTSRNILTLTNAKFHWFRIFGTSNIVDNAAVSPFIGLQNTGNR